MKRKRLTYYDSKYRVLLTEVLPYELPLVYDNDAFYEICKNEAKLQIYQQLLLGNDGAIMNDHEKAVNELTIPFDYEIYRISGTKTRQLSLIHPSVQLGWVELYANYADYLLYLCSKSPYSIRHIYKKANYLIEPNNEDIDEVESENGKDRYQGYFRYQKYDIINRYYDGYEALRLEKKYAYLMTTDISNCFYNIYTHSIAWVIRGKETAKHNIGSNFSELCENKLDKLMQWANYKETNGIVVGPEVSRIFAEIILQQVDLDVMHALKEEEIQMGTDYEIRRYVDDYFVYAHRKEHLEKIQEILEKCLSFYKLHVNLSKTNYFERPFSTDRSDSRVEIQTLLQWLKETIDSKKSISEGSIYLGFVQRYRSLIHHYHVQYAEINGILLSRILGIIKQFYKSKEGIKETLLRENVISDLIELVFYVYALDMTCSTSYKVCHIITILYNAARMSGDKMFIREVSAKIEREIKRSFDLQGERLQHGKMNIEVINMLLTWHRVLPNSKIERNRLAILFGRKSEEEITAADWGKLNYFQIMTMLYIMEDEPEYLKWKGILFRQLKKRFEKSNWRQRSEYVCLFLDLLACPYLSDDDKSGLMTKAKVYKEKVSAKAKLEEMKRLDMKRWFWDWDKDRPFERFLYKKAYHPAYG